MATQTNVIANLNGSVGIGTTNPTQLLDVRGNIKLGADNSGNYVYYVTDIERTIVRTTRSDVSQEGLLRSDGWGNFTFNKSIGVGYSLGSGPLTGNIYAAGSIGIGTTSLNRQITIGSSNQDAIQIRRLTTGQGNSSLGTGISWTWTSATTDDETWAAIRVIMPGNGNSNMTFSTTPVSGGGSGLAERMRITDTGNVGIGSSSPGYKLDVVGDIGFSSTLKFGGINVISNAGGDVYINGRVIRNESVTLTDGMYIGYGNSGTTNGHLRFYANNQTERMRIDASSGNVGIATTSPYSKLTVAVPATNTISTADNANTAGLTISGTGGLVRLQFGVGSSTLGPYGGWIQASYDNTGGNNGLEPLLLNPLGGNVGIGTSSPAARLDVVSGSMRIASGAYAGEINFGTAAGDSTNIYLKRDNNYDLSLVQNASSGNALYLASAGNVYISIDSNNNGTTDAFIVQNNSVKSGTELFRVQENGNVGIGSSSPSAKLDVVDSGNFFVSRDASGYPRFTTTNGSAQLGLFRTGTSAGGFYIGGDDTLFSVWTTGFSRLFNINNSGNVGIGTTTPTQKLQVNGSAYITDVLYSSVFYPVTGITNNDLNSPDTALNAIHKGQSHNYDLFQFNAPNTYETQATNGGAWTSVSVPTGIFAGDTTISGGSLTIANGVYAVRFTWNSVGYRFFNLLYFMQSTAGNSFTATIEHSANGSTWTTVATTGGIGGWPAHSRYMNYWNNSSTQTYLRITLTPSWSNANSIVIYNMRYFCSYYLDGASKLYTWEYDKTFNFSGKTVNLGTSAAYTAGGRSNLELYNSTDSLIALRNPSGNSYIQKTGNDFYINNVTSGNFIVQNSNTERLRINSNGSVGIGASSPQTLLQVGGETSINYTNAILTMQGGTGYGFIRMYGNSSAVEMQIDAHSSNSNAGTVGTFTNHPVYIKTNNTNKVTILADGNVGIGFTSPQRPLEVISPSNNYVSVGVLGLGVGSWCGIHFGYRENNNNYRKSAIVFERTDLTTSDAQGKIHILNGPQGSSGNATLSDAKLTINEYGNIGIGTTSPLSNLHLYGVAPTILTLGSTSYPSTYLTTLGVDAGARAFLIFGNNGENQVRAGRTVAGGYLDFYTNNTVAQTTLASDGNFVMRLAASGNVGVGTTTPTNGRLQVYNASGNTLSLQKSGGGAALMMGSETTNYALIESIVNGGIRFYTGNGTQTEKMRVTAAGEVGIATTAPLTTGGTAGLSIVNSAVALSLGVSDSDMSYIRRLSAGVYQWQTIASGANGGQLHLLPYGGNLGIGTTSPVSKLSVVGTTSVGDGKKLSFIGLDINSSGTPTYIKITTTIPFASGAADFTINIKGFRYGSQENTSLQINWHYYLSTFYNATVSSAGSWAPTIRLSAEGGFVAIVLSSPGYWPKLYVESMYSSAYNDQYASGWTWSDADATGSPIVTVDYKSNFGNGFVMLSNGNVGIGSTGPAYKLDVNGVIASGGSPIAWFSGNYNRIFEPAGNPALYLGNNSDPSNYYDNNTHYFRNRGGSSNYAIINSSGNLGIGTTTVATKFVVAADATDSDVGQLRVIGSTSSAKIINVGYHTTNNYGFVQAIIAGTGYSPLSLQPNGGNVGIGNTSPAYKLDVSGLANVTSAPGTAGTILRIRDTVTAGTESFGGVHFTSSPGTDYTIGKWTTAAGAGLLQIRDQSGNQFVTINGSGNIGIGTTSTAFKLDVNGAIGVGGLRFIDLSTNYFRIFEPAGNIAIYLGNAADPANYYDNTTHSFRNRGGSGTYAVIEGNGNLGIGTSSVTEAIHVYRAANAIIRLQAGGGNVSGVRMDDASSAGYLLKNRSSDVTNNALAGALYTYTDNNKAFQHIHNGTPLFTILSGGNVGIGTNGPAEKLQVLGGIKIGNKLYEVPIDTLSASGTQAQRFEIARVFIDYNDWNQTGPVEIEVRENYYSDGFFKRYVFSYGYNSSNVGRLFLVESNGSSSTDCRVVIGAAVQTSGDIYYVPIYVELDYYARADALVRTNRDRTTNASSTSGGVIYINSGPTGTNISSFDSDEVTYVSAYASKTLLGNNGNVGVSISPVQKFHVDGPVGNPGTSGTSQSGIVRISNSSDNAVLDIGMRAGGNGAWLQSTDETSLASNYSLLLNPNGGSVGIGLTSPTEKLHVSGNLKTTGTITNDGGIYYGGGSNLDINQYNNGYMRFLTNNNEKVRIDANGNVGIGTTSPIYKLDNYNDTIRYTLRCSEKTLAVGFPNGVANQKVDITFDVAPGSYVFWGNFEVEITDGYNNQLSTGQLIKVFAVGMNPATGAGPYGSALFDNTSYYKAAYGAVTINYAIDGIFFNTTTGKYYFTIIHRTSTGNTPIIKIRGFGYDQNASNNIINLTAGSVYTTNTTTYYQPAVEMPLARVGYNGNVNQSGDLIVQGSVGIGLTSPTQKLEVAGLSMAGAGAYRTSIYGDNGGAYLYFGTTANTSVLGTIGTYSSLFNINSLNGAVSFQFSGAEKARITTDGNVGIGSSSPEAKLKIVGASNDLVLDADSSGFAGRYALLPGRFFVGTYSSGYPEIGYNYKATASTYTKLVNDTSWRLTFGNNSSMRFSYSAVGTGAFTWTDLLSINTAGNLGIGTTSPGGKLEIIVSGASDYLRINDNTGVFLDVGRNFITSRGANLTINCQEGAFNLQTAGTTRINVENSTGNVGIGTTSPSTKLDVVGNYMSFGPTTTAARRRQTIAGEITVAGNNTTTKMFTCGSFGTGTISIIAFVTDPSNCATALFSFCHNNPSSGGVGAQTTNRLSFTASVNGVITQIYLDMGNSNPSTQYNVTVTYTGSTAPTVIFSAEGHGSQIWAL